MPTVIAIDPGLTTGIALLTYDQNFHLIKHDSFEVRHTHYDSTYTANDILKQINGRNEAWNPVYVIEDFNYYPSMAREVANNDPHAFTPKLIGALTSLIYEDEFEIKFISPAAKQGCDDALLKKFGLFTKSKHMNDAYRHAVVFIHRMANEN